MSDIKTFKSYNFVTGAVDGTLAYDFGTTETYRDEEQYVRPRKRPARQQEVREQEWIKEDVRSETREAVKNRQGLSPISVMGALCVMVLLMMMLLAQIQLTDISNTAARLEAQIETLEQEQDKLTVEYEKIFNLKDVQDYAVNVLGMQEPEDEQISYLTGVASADRAVVITPENTDMFSLGLEDLLSSVKAYFG